MKYYRFSRILMVGYDLIWAIHLIVEDKVVAGIKEASF